MGLHVRHQRGGDVLPRARPRCRTWRRARRSSAARRSTPTCPSPTLAPYAATKAAIANFAPASPSCSGEKGIRVNSVAPGPIWTPLIPATMPPEKVENFGEDTPLGRPGQPAELAPVYVLLASDEGSYISGARDRRHRRTTDPVTGADPECGGAAPRDRLLREPAPGNADRSTGGRRARGRRTRLASSAGPVTTRIRRRIRTACQAVRSKTLCRAWHLPDAQHGPPARIGSPGQRRFGQGPPRQCSMRWWSGVKPCSTPHSTAWVRLATSILR